MENLYDYWFVDQLSTGSEKAWFLAAIALAAIAGYLFILAYTLPATAPLGGLSLLSSFFGAIAGLGSVWAAQPAE